ncbi:toll/interleukin-1 receptor-like protein, partial [Prunus avium]|uniref:Toll/interleukin-1 receptor-like protein n=1 Tax=Prunus avium TaxID=42229 RepID=A0A6P5RRN9_PRUAV
MPSSASSTPKILTHDVFLSFRGEDTRQSFTSHLYHALIEKGIDTFMDDEKLKRGKPIGPELMKAIEESRFAVVILSRDYASSTWCLDELAHIVDCKKEKELQIFPVFYH